MEKQIFEILGITLFSLLVAAISIEIDARQIIKKWGKVVSLNHNTRFVIRGILFILTAFLMECNLKAIPIILYESCIFWIVFDMGLNLRLKRDPFYIGKTSSIDKLKQKFLSGKQLFYVKVLLALTMLITIFVW